MKEGIRTIQIRALSRVEGEGSLTIRLKGNRATDVQLRIFEPPRFFEAFLRGRSHAEAPDLTARICGICPVAYQMSSCRAIESALDLQVDERVRALRRLLYCGEWIESHALHVFLLNAPDFLGYPDALAMAKEHADAVKRGLRIKKAGNAIVARVGGREIHPINVRIGGFYRAPTRSELDGLLPEIEEAIRAVRESFAWAAAFSFPELEHDYEFLALRHPDEYPLLEGRVVSSSGIDVEASDFETIIVEEQVPYSTALHARIRGRGAYFCGPMARFNLNFDRLSADAKLAARSIGLSPPCKNPFKGILVRLVEIFYALDEAHRIIDTYAPPHPSFVEVAPRAGRGCGCTEAPGASFTTAIRSTRRA